jgi:hypothetical protein
MNEGAGRREGKQNLLIMLSLYTLLAGNEWKRVQILNTFSSLLTSSCSSLILENRHITFVKIVPNSQVIFTAAGRDTCYLLRKAALR